MKRIEEKVWCDVHGTIHDATTDPYDMGFESTGEEPECGPADWHEVWFRRLNMRIKREG